MKNYEFIRASQTILRIVRDNKINVGDVDYIQVYEDWVRFKSEGQKYDWIIYYLGQQYGVSAATISRIVKRMEKDVELK